MCRARSGDGRNCADCGREHDYTAIGWTCRCCGGLDDEAWARALWQRTQDGWQESIRWRASTLSTAVCDLRR